MIEMLLIMENKLVMIIMTIVETKLVVNVKITILIVVVVEIVK
jgi:hypothetical protein